MSALCTVSLLSVVDDDDDDDDILCMKAALNVSPAPRVSEI